MRTTLLALSLAAGCSAGGALDDGGDLPDLATAPDFAGVDLYGVDFAQPIADLAGPVQDLALAAPKLTTQVSVYVEPGAGLTPITQAIAGAKSSVSVEVYLLTDSGVISALIAAHNAGRKVRVILDQNPMGGSNASAFSQLNNAGVGVVYSNPIFTYTHEKAMIVDATALWAMTANLSASAVSSNREYLLVDADAQDIAEAQAIFDADYARQAASASNLVVSPINARGKIDTIIAGATQEIDIEWEELSDNDIAGHLATRIKAGVPVKIIAPSDVAGTATATTLTALKATGAQVKLLASPYVHAKLVLVDRARGFIGSENATTNSLESNRELGVLWQDPTVAQKCASTFDGDFAKAVAY